MAKEELEGDPEVATKPGHYPIPEKDILCEIYSTILGGTCDQMASQDMDWRSIEGGKVRIIVLFLYAFKLQLPPSSSGKAMPWGPGLGPCPSVNLVEGCPPVYTRSLIMIDWESRASTSPDITSLPWRRPNLCGLGMSLFTRSVIRARPIIFFFLLFKKDR